MSADSAPSAEIPDWNPFYELLVLSAEPDTNDRIIGMLAYARYKQIKRDWVCSFRQKHKRYPTLADRQAFVDVYVQKGAIEDLRAGAAALFYGTAEMYAAKTVKAERDALRKDEIAQLLESHHSSTLLELARHSNKWTQFWIGLVSNFMFTLLLIGLAFVATNQFGNWFDRMVRDANARIETDSGKAP